MGEEELRAMLEALLKMSRKSMNPRMVGLFGSGKQSQEQASQAEFPRSVGLFNQAAGEFDLAGELARQSRVNRQLTDPLPQEEINPIQVDPTMQKVLQLLTPNLFEQAFNISEAPASDRRRPGQ